LKHGVKDYTWQSCIKDYRREIASMVLIPMWQYCCFGAGYAEWGEDIDKLIANYEFFLFCQYAGTYTICFVKFFTPFLP